MFLSLILWPVSIMYIGSYCITVRWFMHIILETINHNKTFYISPAQIKQFANYLGPFSNFSWDGVFTRKRPTQLLIGMNECIETSWWNKSNLRPCLIELGMDIWRIKHDEYPVNSQCGGKLRTIICYQLHHSLPSLFNTREFLRCLMIRTECLWLRLRLREEFVDLFYFSSGKYQ